MELSHSVIARSNATGEIVGVLHWWLSQDGDWASIGFMLVKDGHRSKGLGRQLFRRMLGCGATRFCLTATPAGQPLYESEHFQPHQGLILLSGIIESIPAPPLSVRRARPDEFDHIFALDQTSVAGRDRSELLCTMADSWGYFLVHETDGKIDAFALVTNCEGVLHVGPVVAPTDEIALALLLQPLQVGANVWLDIMVPADHNVTQTLLQTGLKQIPTDALTARWMTRGDWPSCDRHTVYALGGLAFC